MTIGSSIKYILGWLVIFAIRLIPFRPPNIEPILATMMPFSKKFGWLGTFMFGFLSIAIFDVITDKTGLWTVVTGVAYGLVGIGSYAYFKNRKSDALNYVIYGIIGTIVYDALTGLTIGPIFWGQTFSSALIGQIPFTINHLIGNIILSALVSPAIYKWVVVNEKIELIGLKTQSALN